MSKNANGQGHIRKRKDNGLWEGQYVAGRKPNGKPDRKSVYGKTQNEVSKKLTALTNDVNTGFYIAPDKITVAQWFDIWLNEYLGAVKETTSTQYKYHVDFNIKPYLGHIRLQKLTTPMIQRLYRTRLNEAPKGGKTLSPKSIKNLHGVIHKALDKAVQCRFIPFNPSDACELPRVEKKEMVILRDEYLTKFLEEIKGKQYENLFFVDLFTGMRMGEIIGLTWDNVDFDKGIIHIVKQLKRKVGNNNKYFFDTLKNGKTRDIAPASKVFSVLRRIKKEQAENKLKYGSSFDNTDNLVFTNEIGEHLGVEAIEQALKRRGTAIGLPELRFHDLRHTYATLSIQNGDDIKTTSESLGHATVAFTLDVYAHVTDKMKRDSADRMQKFIESIGG